MKAPDKIWANASVGEGGFWACDASVYEQGDCHEYHLVRTGQPCSTDEFLRLLQASGWGVYSKSEAIDQWLSGDFTAAMDVKRLREENIIASIQTDTSKLAQIMDAFIDSADMLSSALAIARREGIDGEVASTNWDAFYNRVAVTIKRNHVLSNEVRAAIRKRGEACSAP